MKMRIEIELHFDDMVQEEVITLYPSVKYIIGRDSKDLKLNFSDVSRQHCTLLLNQGTVSLVDNDSANGTKVNAIQIDTTLLQVTDVIEVGPVKIRIMAFRKQDEDTSFFEKTEMTQIGEDPWLWLQEKNPLEITDLWNLVLLFFRVGPFVFFDKVLFNGNWVASLIFLGAGSFIRANALFSSDSRYFIMELMWNIIFILFCLLFMLLGRNILGEKGEFRHYLSFLAISTWAFTPVFMILSLLPTGILSFPLMAIYLAIGFTRVFEIPFAKSVGLFSLSLGLVLSAYFPVNKSIIKNKKGANGQQVEETYDQSNDYLKDL